MLAGPTVRVVDRIEFDPELRRSDIAFDLAFLAMDLEASGQRWAARELVSAYREEGMDPGGEALRSFYAAHWALVRAKVTLIAAAEHDGPARVERLRSAQQLWLLGERLCWRARAPLAVVVCGPAASGKSVLAGELSRRSQMPVVSSDAVRKRLAHLEPSQPARPEHYSAGFTRATYEQLTREALLALQRQGGGDRGRDLPRARGSRGVARRIASAPACRCWSSAARSRSSWPWSAPRGVWRIRRRVSDATPQIAEEQFRGFEEFDEHSEGPVLRLDTSQALDVQIAEIARAVDGCGLVHPGPAPPTGGPYRRDP